MLKFITKSILVFILLVSLSCSSDDNNVSQTSSGKIQLQIQDSTYVYDIIEVSSYSFTDEEGLESKEIKGSIVSDKSETIRIMIKKNQVDQSTLEFIEINFKGTYFSIRNASSDPLFGLEFNLDANNSTTIKGNFAGIAFTRNNEQLMVENGSIEITHQKL